MDWRNIYNTARVRRLHTRTLGPLAATLPEMHTGKLLNGGIKRSTAEPGALL